MSKQTLREAAKTLNDGYGLLYGYVDFAVVNVVNGAIVGPNGPVADLDGFYHARLFDGKRELRWKNGESVEVSVPVDGLDNQYLLWGEAKGHKNGWTKAEEGRAATLWIPCKWDNGTQDVILKTREALAQDRYGNWYVADEVLVGFETVKRPTDI